MLWLLDGSAIHIGGTAWAFMFLGLLQTTGLFGSCPYHLKLPKKLPN